MDIRKYRTCDEEACRTIWNEVVEKTDSFPQMEPLEKGEADRFFKSMSYTGVAADENGDILGLYILHPNNVGRCGHIANTSYAVKSSIRGQHIGEKLVLHSLSEGKKLGFRILQFNAVVADNIHALHLYDRLGFTRLGTVPGGFLKHDGTYEDIILFYHLL